MNTDQPLDAANYAGRLFIESGAEIYRVEETIMRLCMSFSEVGGAQSFITTIGIMFPITVASETRTEILRVYAHGVDLNCIGKTSSLSRETTVQNYTIEGPVLKLKGIENEQRYSFWIIMFFGALSASGFAVFFGGNYLEAGCSFLIGLLIRAVNALIEQHGLYGFFMNAIAAVSGALVVLGTHTPCPDTDVDILIISGTILLVPGLAITNAIRGTVPGDYLSGTARATKASLAAIVIAAGIGVALSVSIGLNGGMQYVSDQYDDCPSFRPTRVQRNV